MFLIFSISSYSEELKTFSINSHCSLVKPKLIYWNMRSQNVNLPLSSKRC